MDDFGVPPNLGNLHMYEEKHVLRTIESSIRQ